MIFSVIGVGLLLAYCLFKLSASVETLAYAVAASVDTEEEKQGLRLAVDNTRGF